MALCMSVAPNCLQRTQTRRDLVLLFEPFLLALPYNQISAQCGQLVQASSKVQLTHHHSHHTSSKCPHGFWTIAQLESLHMPAATATRYVVTM